MFDTQECIKEVIQPNEELHISMEDDQVRSRPSFDLSSRFRGARNSANFYSGLNAEVNAIEMEDLSKSNNVSSRPISRLFWSFD